MRMPERTDPRSSTISLLQPTTHCTAQILWIFVYCSPFFHIFFLSDLFVEWAIAFRLSHCYLANKNFIAFRVRRYSANVSSRLSFLLFLYFLMLSGLNDGNGVNRFHLLRITRRLMVAQQYIVAKWESLAFISVWMGLCVCGHQFHWPNLFILMPHAKFCWRKNKQKTFRWYLFFLHLVNINGWWRNPFLFCFFCFVDDGIGVSVVCNRCRNDKTARFFLVFFSFCWATNNEQNAEWPNKMNKWIVPMCTEGM